MLMTEILIKYCNVRSFDFANDDSGETWRCKQGLRVSLLNSTRPMGVHDMKSQQRRAGARHVNCRQRAAG